MLSTLGRTCQRSVRSSAVVRIAQTTPRRTFLTSQLPPRHNHATATTTHLHALKQLQLIRSFWKKPEAGTETDAAPAAAAAASTESLVPVATTPAPATSESLATTSKHNGESKAERLGFSGFGSAFSSLNLSWARVKTYSIWIAVGSGIMMVFKLGFNIVDFFATVSFLDVGEVAFIGGIVTGLGVAACGMLGTRFLRLRPEPIFKHALKRLSADETVAAYMGRNLTTSEFRAYNFVDASLRAGPEARERGANKSGLYKYYQPKRLQVMFQVLGSNGVTGMATAEVEKNWRGDHCFNLLAIDLVDGRDSSAAERIILEGDPSYRIYKGIIKLR